MKILWCYNSGKTYLAFFFSYARVGQSWVHTHPPYQFPSFTPLLPQYMFITLETTFFYSYSKMGNRKRATYRYFATLL